MNIDRKCVNCGSKLEFVKREALQLGRTSLLIGNWPNLIAGALDVEIWGCHDCGKLEFYLAAPEEELASGIAKTSCERCGVEYDLDYPKCPCCGAKNEKW